MFSCVSTVHDDKYVFYQLNEKYWQKMAQIVAESVLLFSLNSSMYQMVRYRLFRYNDEFNINVIYNMC